jgi:hypothetical protein
MCVCVCVCVYVDPQFLQALASLTIDFKNRDGFFKHCLRKNLMSMIKFKIYCNPTLMIKTLSAYVEGIHIQGHS